MFPVADDIASVVKALAARMAQEPKCQTIEISVQRDGRAYLALYDGRQNLIGPSHQLDTLESGVVVELSRGTEKRL